MAKHHNVTTFKRTTAVKLCVCRNCGTSAEFKRFAKKLRNKFVRRDARLFVREQLAQA